MPIRHAVMHFIDKKPDGSPAVLYLAGAGLPQASAIRTLAHNLNEGYDVNTGKAQGFFHGDFDT